HAALWAACFWTVISGDRRLQANLPNTEAFINAILVWVVALVVRPAPGWTSAVGIGLLCALASLYKPVAILAPACLLGIVLVWPSDPEPGARRRVLVQIAVIVAVGAVVGAMVLGWFAGTGRWPAFRAAVIDYNRFYVGDPLQNLASS